MGGTWVEAGVSSPDIGIHRTGSVALSRAFVVCLSRSLYTSFFHSLAGVDFLGLGFRVKEVGARRDEVLSLLSIIWVGVSGVGFRILGFGFRVSGFGFRVPGFGFRVSGFGFRVLGLRMEKGSKNWVGVKGVGFMGKD